ncbi:MAG: hypothetical protein RLZZ436_964 [Planctomycetota bacterium]
MSYQPIDIDRTPCMMGSRRFNGERVLPSMRNTRRPMPLGGSPRLRPRTLVRTPCLWREQCVGRTLYPRAAALRLSAWCHRDQGGGRCRSRVTVRVCVASFAAGADEGRTVNVGERVGEVLEVRSEKSEVRSFVAVSGRGGCVWDFSVNAGGEFVFG